MALIESAEAPRALLLDLDATLLDNGDAQVPVRRTCEILATLRPELDADVLQRVNNEAWAEYAPGIADLWQRGGIDGASVSLETWHRALALLGIHEPELEVTARDVYLQCSREHYRLFDDAEPLLRAAREAAIPLALITNGASDSQRDKLDAVAITELFDAIVISGEVGIVKPDPAIFAIALGRLGMGSAGVWHVGDSLASDVAGARGAGLTAVWLNRGGDGAPQAAPRPDLEISTLADLAGMWIR